MQKSLYSFLLVIFLSGIYVSCNEIQSKPIEPEKIEPFISDSVTQFLRNFDQEFAQEFKRQGIPGGAVVVIKGSRIIYQNGFGVKERGTQDSVDINTVFRLGSVSKGFASVLAGTAVDKNFINWEDPVTTHLPDFGLNDPDQTERTKVKHLLSHTTGLPRHAYTNLVEDGLSLNRIIPRLENVELISEEGVQFSYQNAAYAVIEKVLESKYDTTFSSLLTQELFEPIGMTQSSSTLNDLRENENRALPHLYHSRRRGLVPVPITKKYYNAISAGGINASISDMGKWLLLLTGNNPEVISDEALDYIFEPVVTIDNRRFSRYWDGVNESHYGMGWRILDNDGQKIIYHGGYVNGYRSEIAFDRENQVGICILFNSSSGYALRAIPKFFEEFKKVDTTSISSPFPSN